MHVKKICNTSRERGPYESAKSIDHSQPAEADHGRNFSLLADFVCIK